MLKHILGGNDANHSGHRQAMTKLSSIIKTASAKYLGVFNKKPTR